MAVKSDARSAEPRCPACESRHIAKAFEVQSVIYLRCRDCDSVFDFNPAAPEQLWRLYEGPDYFVKGNGQNDVSTPWGYGHDYLADRPFSEAKFERVMEHLERYVSPGALLDVGAGPGFLLTVANRRGWRSVGIDVNRWAAEYARDQGVDVRACDLMGAGFRDGEFDAVTMMDMLEHVPDPDILLGETARIVRPGGAIAVLTPDAGSAVSKLLGGRWPEVRRPGEHAVLYSIEGIARLLARSGFVACGWHPIGKIAPVATFAADVESVAPQVLVPARKWITQHAIGERILEFDPRTKFCVYARRLPVARRHPGHRPARIPKHPERLVAVESAILEELESVSAARRYCDWMFEQFSALVAGHVAEIGAGIGTFSRRIIDHGAESLLLMEPDHACAKVLEERFASDGRVGLSRDMLPDAPSLASRAGDFDLVVCQNVLEHVGDDVGALTAMRRALRPGGHLALVVPANPHLFGPLDEAYGHWRRYAEGDLRDAVRAAGFGEPAIRAINALGVVGWWTKNRRPAARIRASSFATFEAILPFWKPLDRLMPRTWGLSLVCIASTPTA